MNTDTASIVDRIEAALDSSALLTICTVFKAGTDHFVQNPTRDGALDYLNMMEAVCIIVNRGLVGRVTEDQVETRVEFEVGLIEKAFPGLMDEATMKPSDLCEIRAVIANAKRKAQWARIEDEWPVGVLAGETRTQSKEMADRLGAFWAPSEKGEKA